MHHPNKPVSWRDIAAAYDARGLPFLRFFIEARQAERRPRDRRRS